MAPQGTARCAICQTPLEGAPLVACSACQAPYHADCWEENRGCAVYGCSEVPPTEKLREVEMESSYWGQANKACPSCGASILAAALRCRACGAMLEAGVSQDPASYRRREAANRQIPALKRTVVVLFVLSILPCSAPVGGLGSLVWLLGSRPDLKSLPPLHAALGRLAPVLGIAQTVAIVLFVAAYAVFRT